MPLAVHQAAAKPSNGTGSTMAVTFGSAPTNGNLLVALVFSLLHQPAVNTGWTLDTDVSFSGVPGTCYIYSMYKYAGVSESTTQTPNSATLDFGYTQVWEVSGVSGTWANDHDKTVLNPHDTGSGQTTMTFGTTTTGAPNDLGLFGGTGRNGGLSVGTAFTVSGGSATTDDNPLNASDASSGIGFHQAFPTSGTTTPAYSVAFNGTGYYGSYSMIFLKSSSSTETATVSVALNGVAFAANAGRHETATATLALNEVSFTAAAGRNETATASIALSKVSFVTHALQENETGTVSMVLKGVAFSVATFDLNALNPLRQFATFG